MKNNENVFVSLLFNILLPVFILNRLTTQFGEDGPWIALLVALAFPVSYAIWDHSRRSGTNMISVLGILNVLTTGGLALLGLSGISFAIKEAAFPLLIGVAVYISAYSRKPFIETLFMNDKIINLEQVQERLAARNAEAEFRSHLRRSTIFLSGSFLLSAALNFGLGYHVFPEMAEGLSPLERSALLNEQIARMTWMSMAVIVLPSMVCLAAILWHLIRGVSQLTGLHHNEILKG